ncbi:hypothetical protein DM02DRAFT_136825 [Periconia macrospinosa]|uniref:Uncharacterized protein n=1 Tax=Periconia macrospinosa TaxID=97972 RepID=A0A2V1DE59_9PLEO|nr:hypothetical protein DM02DRAFT_136825 [Periconia macrospinosa]
MSKRPNPRPRISPRYLYPTVRLSESGRALDTSSANSVSPPPIVPCSFPKRYPTPWPAQDARFSPAPPHEPGSCSHLHVYSFSAHSAAIFFCLLPCIRFRPVADHAGHAPRRPRTKVPEKATYISSASF